MAMRVVVGPPFAGKSQRVDRARLPGQAVVDTTSLWRAVYDPGPDDIRTPAEAAVVNTGKRRMVERLRDAEADGYVIIAERRPTRVASWLNSAGADKAMLVSEPMDELKDRARAWNQNHGSNEDCEGLLDAWDNFEEDPEFMALVDNWDATLERAMDKIEKQYREACESVTVRDCGEDVQQRCVTLECDLRAEDGASRVIRGIAVRYGDKADIWGWKETIRAGALKLPKKASNFTIQHDRALPIGLLEYEDGTDALRIRCEIADGMRGDQALSDVRAGLWRGLSIEFMPTNDIVDSKKQTVEITEGKLYRVSLVDDPAYPKSKLKRAGCGCGGRGALEIIDDPPPPPPNTPSPRTANVKVDRYRLSEARSLLKEYGYLM